MTGEDTNSPRRGRRTKSSSVLETLSDIKYLFIPNIIFLKGANDDDRKANQRPMTAQSRQQCAMRTLLPSRNRGILLLQRSLRDDIYIIFYKSKITHFRLFESSLSSKYLTPSEPSDTHPVPNSPSQNTSRRRIQCSGDTRADFELSRRVLQAINL